jgi:hypothetical protein
MVQFTSSNLGDYIWLLMPGRSNSDEPDLVFVGEIFAVS